MDRCGGVFLQLGVAARGINVGMDFIKVLLGEEENCGVALFGREELQAFLLFLEGLQSNSLSRSEVVRSFVCLAVEGGEDFNNQVGSRGFHAIREVFQGVLDPRSGSGVGSCVGVGTKLSSRALRWRGSQLSWEWGR